MFDDRNQSKIIGFIEFIFDLIGGILYLIWIPIRWILRLLGNFVKDVATGVYGKIVQATVVLVFGLIAYFFQTHIK